MDQPCGGYNNLKWDWEYKSGHAIENMNRNIFYENLSYRRKTKDERVELIYKWLLVNIIILVIIVIIATHIIICNAFSFLPLSLITVN